MNLTPDMSLTEVLSAVAAGRAELTPLGRRLVAQLVEAEQERAELAEAVTASAYLGRGLPPRRWCA